MNPPFYYVRYFRRLKGFACSTFSQNLKDHNEVLFEIWESLVVIELMY